MGFAWGRFHQKGDLLIEIIQRNEFTHIFSPFAHCTAAAMLPRQHLNTPVAFLQAFKRGMKTLATAEATAITSQQDNNARVAVIVKAILKHSQLQCLINTLFSARAYTPPLQVHFKTCIFQPVPQHAEFGRHRTCRVGTGYFSLSLG